MASILTTRNLSKTYSTHTLFTDVSITLNDDDRLGLIGPNGSGKSTLLKILANLETPDTGEIICRKQLALAYVPQDDTFPADATPLSTVTDKINPNQSHHHHLDIDTRASITLSKLGFEDLHQPVATLSGGWRKRLSIACALANEPDVLMLDEPTNHLDLEGVLWLEQFVRSAPMAVVIVTHDRIFLESVANRIIELSRVYPGGTFEAKGNYSYFVRRKEEFLDAQAAQQSAIAGKVRRDTQWLKQGIQGRQTRNKSQVDAADIRRTELKDIKARNAAIKQTTAIDFQATERKTKKLLAAHNLSKTMGNRKLFDKISFILKPGMHLGLLGPNGSGKTTLLRILNNDISPDTGSIKTAADLHIVSFTQHREALNPTMKLREALCPVGDTLDYRGKAIHVTAWAKKFLFDPSKFNTSVGDLSGGEQARILIANLMLKPADVLILDEPTNDLDIPSLEVLEQSLTEFPGAIVLVTHDRFMLARLCTELLALDGQGNAKSFITYDQYQQFQKQSATQNLASEKPRIATPAPAPAKPKTNTQSKKLSYKLQRELDMMEENILAAEAQLEQAQQLAADPAVIANPTRHADACHKLADAQTHVQNLYNRWAELEQIQQSQ